jgi:hypothetical protein
MHLDYAVMTPMSTRGTTWAAPHYSGRRSWRYNVVDGGRVRPGCLENVPFKTRLLLMLNRRYALSHANGDLSLCKFRLRNPDWKFPVINLNAHCRKRTILLFLFGGQFTPRGFLWGTSEWGKPRYVRSPFTVALGKRLPTSLCSCSFLSDGGPR